MNKESAVLDRELERDSQQAERSAMRKPDASMLPGATAPESSSKRSLGERIKDVLTKVFEGDHGTHHYRS